MTSLDAEGKIVHVALTDFEMKIRAFLAECWDEDNPTEALPIIDSDTDLFEAGVLDSLLVVELLAFVEDAFNVVIDVTQIDDPSSFFTLRGMHSGLESHVAFDGTG